MARVTGMAKKENLAKIVSDVSALERGYNEVKTSKVSASHGLSMCGEANSNAE